MSCGSCGGSGCDGKCKKSCIKVYKPTSFIGGQTGIPGPEGESGPFIVNIVDNENGTFTIFMSDTTEYIITMPGTTIPNDDWVVYSNTDPEITSFDVPTGLNITTNESEVQVAYKPISADTALVKVRAYLNVTITNGVGFNARDIDQILDFDFILADIPIGGSNWFPTQTGKFSALFPDVLGNNFGVPVSIIPSDGAGVEDPLANGDFYSQGRGSVTNGLFFCQAVCPHVAAGTYGFLIEWEMICRIEHF